MGNDQDNMKTIHFHKHSVRRLKGSQSVSCLARNVSAGGSEAVDAVIRVWHSLHISEHDFSQLMSALEDLVAARDLKTLTSYFTNVADHGQLNELKRVWRTWIELSKQKGCRVTEMRNAAFEGDGEVEDVMRNYLMAIPQNHRESVKLWRAEGIFTSQCEASSLTPENMTFTGSSFKYENSKGDYNFYEYMVDHRSDAHNLSSCEIKA